ncbi:MAG: hypothetical protein ACM34O_05610 [Ignavibacteria bacterium]
MNFSKVIGHELERLVNECGQLVQIQKNELQPGDYIILKTINSVYIIKVLEDGYYAVSGGWFDKNESSPVKTTISGCTWGGCIIKTDIIAACGLCLEFGNKVITSSIKKIFHISHNCEN